MSAVRVVLVDDHAMMRAGFRAILDAQTGIEVVGEAPTGRRALEVVRETRPDVVCMDVQMPDMDGLEATRLLTADPVVEARVLVVTTFDRDDYLFQALDAGASGFLLKNAGPEEIVRAVRAVAAGDALLAPEVTRRVIERFAAASAGHPPVTAARPAGAAVVVAPAEPATTDDAHLEPALTDRERDVLRLMTDALSNAEIAARLYIGEATVKTHVSNVLRALGARDRVQAIVLAYRRGLV